jgi:signal transduction histidine kinase
VERHAATDSLAAEVLDLLALEEPADADPTRILARIVVSARRLVWARYAAIGVPDGRGGFARFVTAGISEKRAAQIGELPRTHGVLGALIDEGPILLDDIRNHPRFSYFPAHHPVMTDFLGVPIRRGKVVVGNLFVSGQRAGRFSRRDQRALETLAGYAAVAIANADLYLRAQRLAVVEERNRVARELHDAATQSLFGLVLEARSKALTVGDAAAREALGEFERRAATALSELRGLVHALRPKSLERDGLAATLTDQVETLRRGGVDVGVQSDAGIHLSLDEEHDLLRIAQEAIHNAVRHAPGAPLRVTLLRHGDSVVLRVRDGGPGFDTGQLRRTRRGIGLSTMRERAAHLGARLELVSAPGRGCSVTVRLRLGASLAGAAAGQRGQRRA